MELLSVSAGKQNFTAGIWRGVLDLGVAFGGWDSLKGRTLYAWMAYLGVDEAQKSDGLGTLFMIIMGYHLGLLDN